MHRVWTSAFGTISFAAVVLAGTNLAQSSTGRSSSDTEAPRPPAADRSTRTAAPRIVSPTTLAGVDPALLRRLIREELASERAASCAPASANQPAAHAEVPPRPER